jgi:hypothetical protein
MEHGASNFMAQVQGQLNELGSAPTLTASEQDVVADFQEQEFSAQRCAQRIAEERGAK